MTTHADTRPGPEAPAETSTAAALPREWARLLGALPFLSSMSEDVLEQRLVLGKIPQAELPAALVEVAAGELVVREGEFGDTFYVVVSGEFVVEVWQDDGTPVEVERLRRGACFGELAMIGHGLRTMSVRAVGPQCQVIEMGLGPFERLMKDDRSHAVRAALEEVHARRSIARFMARHALLRALTEEDRQQVVAQARLVRVEPLQEVFRAGDIPRSCYFVRQGFLKAWRLEGEVESVLAYLRDNDFFGDLELIEGRPRTATVTSMEPVELVEIPRAAFAAIYQRYPTVIHGLRRFELDRRASRPAVASTTSLLFKKSLVESGMAQARSALVIDMDTCTRCGNCVQACADLHDGHARLVRRGKRLTRREPETRQLENLFFPNSCVHCRAPECMSGCPVGAIARDKDGEVYIKDNCVGCGVCARGCEFGNISMVLVGDKQAARPQRRASKCDVCKGHAQASCVFNCPQGSIVRVDPNTYFEELQPTPDLVTLARGSAATEDR